jgi:hypothetical protein
MVFIWVSSVLLIVQDGVEGVSADDMFDTGEWHLPSQRGYE